MPSAPLLSFLELWVSNRPVSDSEMNESRRHPRAT